MPARLRKFVGMLVLVALVVVYALVAMTIAAARLPGTGWLAHLAYFVFTGLLWVLPAMAIVKWMAGKPDQRR